MTDIVSEDILLNKRNKQKFDNTLGTVIISYLIFCCYTWANITSMFFTFITRLIWIFLLISCVQYKKVNFDQFYSYAEKDLDPLGV